MNGAQVIGAQVIGAQVIGAQVIGAQVIGAWSGFARTPARTFPAPSS